MANRTTDQAVKDTLLDNYDSERAFSLTRFISMANSMTNRIQAADTKGILSEADLTLIETLLGAHYYTLGDELFSSREEGKSKGTFKGQSGRGLDSSQFGQAAMEFDATGTLVQINRDVTKGKTRQPGAIWLGTEA